MELMTDQLLSTVESVRDTTLPILNTPVIVPSRKLGEALGNRLFWEFDNIIPDEIYELMFGQLPQK